MINLQKKLFGAVLAALFLCEVSFFVISAEKTLKAETADVGMPAGVAISGSTASSRMLSMASSQAEARKPQVFTTAMSAPAGDGVSSWPADWTRDIICSQLTWFLAQPRERKYTL